MDKGADPAAALLGKPVNQAIFAGFKAGKQAAKADTGVPVQEGTIAADIRQKPHILEKQREYNTSTPLSAKPEILYWILFFGVVPEKLPSARRGRGCQSSGA